MPTKRISSATRKLQQRQREARLASARLARLAPTMTRGQLFAAAGRVRKLGGVVPGEQRRRGGVLKGRPFVRFIGEGEHFVMVPDISYSPNRSGYSNHARRKEDFEALARFVKEHGWTLDKDGHIMDRDNEPFHSRYQAKRVEAAFENWRQQYSASDRRGKAGRRPRRQ